MIIRATDALNNVTSARGEAPAAASPPVTTSDARLDLRGGLHRRPRQEPYHVDGDSAVHRLRRLEAGVPDGIEHCATSSATCDTPCRRDARIANRMQQLVVRHATLARDHRRQRR